MAYFDSSRPRRTLPWLSAALVAGAIALQPSLAAADPSTPPPLSRSIEVDTSDPLYPNLLVDRPLSNQEQRTLRAALEDLRLEGQQQYNAGNTAAAFDIWMRELRLRQVLSLRDEVAALSRVGDVAWQENQTTEIRLIGNRLGEVEQVIRDRPNPDYGLLLQIADAYKTLRERDRAIAAYSDIIQRANQRGDIATEATALAALGEVHLAWFDYGSARPVYQRLLTLRQQQQDTLGEQQALGKLVIVYDETTQPDAAIDARQALVRRYRQSGDLSQVPGLKIAIAERHRELGQLNAAVQAYQEAAVTGQRIGFVGYVADAYRGLASLYLESDRPRDALTAYRFLVDAERQAYNTYGMMEAFDQIGQIHRSLGANQPAIAAFQRGLALAQQLSYRTAYFTAQIQSVQGQ